MVGQLDDSRTRGGAQAHQLAQTRGYFIVGHPPTDPRKQAACACDQLMRPAPYLVRNTAIVESTDVLIAAPHGMVEQLRSGTWATIRHARWRNRPCVIAWPDGTTTVERWT